MCDTVVMRDSLRGGWWFAKNSDREPDEPQYGEYHPAVRNDPSPVLRTTYLTVPQRPDRHAILISRPSWIWGAEMGVNAHGLAIGNEAVFSRRPGRLAPRLRGMDLVRLGLERATTAAQAVAVMTSLLETYGQGGPAGYRNKRFAYDNSFLIVDPHEAFILETAGRQWAVKKVTGDFAAISNGYRLHTDWDRCGGGFGGGDFAARHGDGLVTWIAGARARRCAAEAHLRAMAEGAGPSFSALAALMRHHRRGDGFRAGSNRDICMHWGGRWRPWRPSATTASMIAYLPPDGPPKVMLTGRMTPCINPFRPGRFDADWMARHFPRRLVEDGWKIHARAARDAGYRDRRRAILARLEPALFEAVEGDAPPAALAARLTELENALATC